MDISQITKQREKFLDSSNEDWKEILDISELVNQNVKENGYLSVSTFDRILDWKHSGNIGQTSKIKENYSESLISNISRCFLEIEHPNPTILTRIRMHLLLGIPWMGIASASAIASFLDPKNYGPIDSQVWKSIYRTEKKTFTAKDYLEYLSVMRKIASMVKFDVQEICFILAKIELLK